MNARAIVREASVAVAIALTSATVGVSVPRAQNNNQPETLVMAVYDGQNTASQAFKTMKTAQGDTGERIVSYAVVSKDLKGKVKVVDQRKTGAGVGAVVGGVIGLVGGPAGVAAGATAGSAFGYLTGDAVGISRDSVKSMEQALTPDSSAVIVVLYDQWMKDVQKDMNQANARQVIANQITPKGK
jgi:uncharacterized membrane protein